MQYNIEETVNFRTIRAANQLYLTFNQQISDALGVAPEQFATLRIIGEGTASTQAEIAQAMSKGHSTVSRTLTALEKKGLIRRKGTGKDKRANTIRLTSEGEEILARGVPLALEFSEAMLACLTPEEAAAFFDALEKIRAAAETYHSQGPQQ